MGVASSPLACSDKPIISQDQANGVVSGTIAAVGPSKCFPVWGPFNLVVYGVLADALTTTANSGSATVNSSTGVSVGDSINSTLVPPGTTVKTSPGAGAITLAFPTQCWMGLIPGGAQIRFPGDQIPSGMTIAALVGSTISDPNGYFAAGTTVLGVGPDGVSLLTSAPPTTTPANRDPLPLEFKLGAKCVTAAGTDAAATFQGAATPIGAATTALQLERSFNGGAGFVLCNTGSYGSLAQWTTLTGPLSLSFGEPEAGMLYRLNCTVFSAQANVTINYRFSASGQAGKTLQTPAIM